MQKAFSWFILLCLSCFFISSCGTNQTPSPTYTPAITQTSIPPTFTFTPKPTETVTPTLTPTPPPTITPYPINEPGFIVTLGKKVDSPWHPAISLFSPNGQIVALATRKIRLWDVKTQQLIRELIHPYPMKDPSPENCHVENALFSPDNNFFAVSITGCQADKKHVGHLLVWKVATGELLYDWEQAYASLEIPKQTPYSIPVHAMAFLPDSTRLAFANGNTIEIRNINKDGDPIILELGEQVYASEISIRDDGEYLYVLMSWDKLL